MKKVLMVATYGDFFAAFETNNIKILNDMGCEVHLCANWTDANYNYKYSKLDGLKFKKINIEFDRSPYTLKNFKNYKKLSNLMKQGNYYLLDCHNAVVGAYARLAAKKNNISKVMYTAHGFQFYKKGPKKDWMIYYPIERFLSRFTDVLVVMNEEDNGVAQKFYSKELFFIHGIGVNLEKSNSESEKKLNRADFGIPRNSFVILSVGELSKRKNHEVVIEALKEMNDKDIYYLIAGEGQEKETLLKKISDANLSNNIKLLGFRTDVNSLNKMADIAIFPSLREGLMIAGIESLANGTPIIASNRKGLADYTIDYATGFRIEPKSVRDVIQKINYLKENIFLLDSMKQNAIIKSKEYSLEVVENEMRNIYLTLINKE